ncbi:hypothetical protein ASG96_10455 [Terrabacter sp. Soil810]|nr:hypothetical protein ASG96_10455 [Terrabacter sp. Soil810]
MTVTGRQTVLVAELVAEYTVDRDLVDRVEAEGACQAVLDVVLPRVETAWIDAISDQRDLPAAARATQAALVHVGLPQGCGDSGFGIELDVRQPKHVSLLRAFASWSIGVELYDASMRWVAYFSDTGSSLSFNVTDAEAAAVRASLGRLSMIPISELKARRR